MTAPFWYRGYGLLFRSDIDLPELTPAEAGAEDAFIRVAPDASGVDALSEERSGRLDRIVSADFLTDAEKRVSLGFPAEAGERS